MAQIGNEMTVVAHVLLYNVNKFGQIFPFHVFAFSVEVEPGIVKVLIFKFLVNACELLTDSVLATLAVD